MVSRLTCLKGQQFLILLGAQALLSSLCGGWAWVLASTAGRGAGPQAPGPAKPSPPPRAHASPRVPRRWARYLLWDGQMPGGQRFMLNM